MTRETRLGDWLIIVGGMVALLVFAIANLLNGEVSIGFKQAITALFFSDKALLHDMMFGFRAPRVVVGVLAGSALAVSGALMQSLLRNPLVSPGILGISSGSYLAIVLATLFAPALLERVPLFLTVSGGWIAVVLVYLLSGGRKGTPLRIVLSGLIVSMTLGGLTTSLLLMHIAETRYLIGWGAGSLRQNDWTGVQFAWPWIIGSLALIFCASKQFDIARLGKATAASLGQRHQWVMGMTLLLVLLMTGATVTVAGPIGFIGLLAPHLVKLAGVHRHAILLPASALWGAALLLAADTLTYLFGDLLSTPPVGAVTAALGAPCLLWLVLRHRRRHAGGMHAMTGFGFRRRFEVSPWILGGVLALLLFVLLVINCVWLGGYTLHLEQLMDAAFMQGNLMHQKMLWGIRLPRILNAFLAGAGFAAAGALFQAILRNPLADSAVIGVTGGATVGSVLLVAAVPTVLGAWLPFSALVGGLVAGGIVYGLAWRRGFMPTVLILIGVSVSAICGAVVQIIIMQNRFTNDVLTWITGSLYGTGWSSVCFIAVVLVVTVPLAWLLCKQLEVLSMGDLVARGLGVPVEKTRLWAGLLGIVIAAVCVSQTGPIGYIGLIAPHCARLLAGHQMRALFCLVLPVGALILGLSDTISRILISPAELPAGAVIALVGAPYLIYLMHRNNRRSSL